MNALNPFSAKTNHHYGNQSIPSVPVLAKPHLTSLSFETPLRISSCYAKTPQNKPFKPLIPPSFLKPTLISTITAAALFFTGFNFNPKQAIAAPVTPPSTVDTTAVDEAVVEENTEKAFEEEKQVVSSPAVGGAVAEENVEKLLEEGKQAISAPVTPPLTVDTTTVKEVVVEENTEKSLKEDSNPSEVEILKKLLKTRIQNRNLLDAINIIEMLIKLQPDKTEWRFLKSDLYVRNGELELAKLSLRDIILKDPYQIEAYRKLISAAYEGDSIEEMNKVEIMIEEGIKMCVKENKDSEMREFKLLLAQIWVIECKYEDALKIYRELEKQEPMDFRPYMCQGIIYTKLRKNDKAEKYLKKYRGLVPKDNSNAKFEFMMST